MSYLQIIIIVVGVIIGVVLTYFIVKQLIKKKNGGDDPDKPKTIFKEIKGLSGSGYCYGDKNTFPSFTLKNDIANETDCQQLCLKDDNCLAVSYDSTGKNCILYEQSGGTTPESAEWESSYAKFFPSYASPYHDCQTGTDDGKTIPVAMTKDGCRVAFPDVCKGPVSGVSCWKKYKNRENYTKYTVKVGKEDSSKCQIVLSNPFLYTNELIETENTFYWWLLDLINKATKYVTLCNAYVTLGKYQSDDSDDVESAVHVAILNALKRGVQVTIIATQQEQIECQNSVFNQPGYLPYQKATTPDGRPLLDRVLWNGFFHDKIYISENKAYIGGQNMSGSSSIDFGISIDSSCPIHADILSRTIYMYYNGTTPLTFNYTADNPWIADDGTKYFIAVSPVWPLCPTTGSGYPKVPCPFQNPPVGPFTKGYPPTSGGNVSYEYNQTLNLINNAKKFIKLTNYELSTMGNIYNGESSTLLDALIARAQAGVKVEFWVSNSPFQDSVYGGENALCMFGRCNKGKEYLKQIKNLQNFTLNFWYQNPGTTEFSECHPLHSKIFFSDWGLLVSSSNFTPDYFGSTQDTGFCAIYNGYAPDWISVGMESIFDLLKSKSTITYKDTTFTCKNDKPNFQTTDFQGKPMCTSGFCKGTCMTCGNLTTNSCNTKYC